MLRNLTLYRLHRTSEPTLVASVTGTTQANSEFVVAALAKLWRCHPSTIDRSGVIDAHTRGPHTFEASNVFGQYGTFRLWMEDAPALPSQEAA